MKFSMKLPKVNNLVLISLALFVVVGAVLYFRKQENFHNEVTEIYFFYVNWCPHCVKAKPEVAKFKRNNSDARVIEVNCEEQPELAKKYDVRAYPTVIGVSNGKRVEFNNRVTEENLNDFFSSLLN